MASIGSLRVELELVDGSFTTRVIRAGTTLRSLTDQTGQTVVAVRRLDSTLSNFGSLLKSTVVTLGLARAAVENVYTVFGAWAVSIARVSGEMQRMNLLLRGMSQGITEVEQAAAAGNSVRFLNDLARSAPFALRDLTAAFVRLQAGGIENTTRSMQSLTDAVAAFGGSPQQLERASIALQQMAGKGVISMEELRQQLGEAVPSALPLMARALGTSVDDLVKRISDGRVRAAPALAALSAEFERTFGGRAQAMMNTFNGQIQQLQNNWMRLQTFAGGIDAGGATIQGGFIDALTKGLTALNQALMSPDAQGAAIRFGQILSNVTVRLIELGGWVKENASLLITLASVVGGALLLSLSLSAARMLAVAINATLLASATRGLIAGMSFLVVGALPAMAAGLLRLGAGINLVAVGFGTLIARVAAFGTAAGLVAGFGAIRAALASIPVALTAFNAGIDASIARLFAWATAGTAATATMRIALMTLAVAGGIGLVIAAFSLLGTALEFISRKYRELTRDAGAAYDRIRQGATDTSTIAAATAEADAVAAAVARARAQLVQLRSFAQFSSQGRLNLEGISGEGVIGDTPSASLRRGVSNNVQREEDARAVREAIAQRERLEREGMERIAIQRETILSASARREQQIAEQAADLAQARTQEGLLVRRAEYQQFGRDLEEARRAVDRAFNAGDLERDERDRQLSELAKRNLESQLNIYDRERAAWENTLNAAAAAQRAVMDSAAREQNRALTATERDSVRKQEATIRRAEENMERLKRAGEEATAAAGTPGAGAFGEADNLATRERQAETMLRNLAARVAELRAQSAGLRGELARVNSLIESGLFRGVEPDKIANLRAAATAVDELEEQLKRFREGQQGQQTIETGLDRARRELEGYVTALDSPELPEAQRRFIEFQRQMEVALLKVQAATGGMGLAFRNAAFEMGQAVETARQGSIVSQVEALVRQGEAARVSALPPTQRAAEQTEQLRRRVAGLRTEVEGMNVADARRAQLLTTLNAAERELAASYSARQDRAGAVGANRTASMVAGLRARLAELREEVVDGLPQLEKYRALLERPGSPTGAAAAEVLSLAAAIDAETKILERATKARNAYNAAERQVEESASRVAEYWAQLQDPARAEGNRQLVVFRAQVNEMVRLAQQARAALPAGDGRLGAATAAVTAAEARAGEA